LRFNPPGPELSFKEWRAIQNAVARNLKHVGLLILSGSLPRGVPAAAYARLIQLAHRAGVRTLLDCDGSALVAGAKARPFLVKPNEYELAQWWGNPLRSESEILRAARALSKVTRGWVLVSRGEKKALLLNRETQTVFAARPPRVKVRNTVGAGDALLAAVSLQIQRGAAPEDWLRFGVATGVTATQSAAGKLPSRKLLEKILKRVRTA
jgi:1-phosphofructokinase family hexose kinase